MLAVPGPNTLCSVRHYGRGSVRQYGIGMLGHVVVGFSPWPWLPDSPCLAHLATAQCTPGRPTLHPSVSHFYQLYPSVPTVSTEPHYYHCINCTAPQCSPLYQLQPGVPHYIVGSPEALGNLGDPRLRRSSAVSSLLSHLHPVLGPQINLYTIGIFLSLLSS